MKEALELLVSGGSQEALEPCVAAGVVGGAPAAARGTAPPPSVAYATPVVDVRLAYVFATPFVYGRRDGTTSAVPSIDAAQELVLVRSALRSAGRRVRFVAEVATAQRIRRLMTLGCDLLHYSGHGVSEGLALEADRGADVHVVSRDALCALIGAGGEVRTRLVFVSACHSEPAGRAFVRAGVRHVVCVKRDAKVSDASSRTFARQFYLALLVGKTVRQAFDIGARSASVEQGSSTGATAASATDGSTKFLLLPETGDHGVPLVAMGVPEGDFLDETRPPAPNGAPTAPKPFVGRARELAETARYLSAGARCVSVVGPPGIGKSALASKIAEYVALRRTYGAVAVAAVDDAGDPRDALVDACRRVAPRKDVAAAPSDDVFGALAAAAGGDAPLLVIVDFSGTQPSGLVRALSKILLRTRALAFLVLAERPLHASTPERLENEAEKVVELGALDRRSAALLLVQLAPRRLLRHETGGPDGGIEGLANHAVVGALRGRPRAIARFAPKLQHLFLDRNGPELLRAAQDAAADAVVEAAPPPPAPASPAFSYDSAEEIVTRALDADFRDAVPGRRLSGDDAAFLMALRRDKGEPLFRSWWKACLELIRATRREWAARRPVLVQGFVSRAAAQKLLLGAGAARGDFLLRVSESRDGRLVASFVGDGRAVNHCLISSDKGKVSIAIGTRKNEVSHYDSLRKLVVDSRNLLRLCPGRADKKDAFAQLAEAGGADPAATTAMLLLDLGGGAPPPP